MQIKILDIVFENKIKQFEIEAFRGAISRLVGFENTLFHNHLSNERLAYSYPLVQYKIKNGKASFSCIAQGVEEASHFFTNKNWQFTISGRSIKLEIDTFQLRNAYFDVKSNTTYEYTLNHWQPFNQDNVKKFNELKTTEDKINLLEAILIGNILSMGKSLNWKIESQIKLSIEEILDQVAVKFKKNQVIVFDVKFSCNVLLPRQIGLGKAVSHGFGVIEKRTELNKRNYE